MINFCNYVKLLISSNDKENSPTKLSQINGVIKNILKINLKN